MPKVTTSKELLDKLKKYEITFPNLLPVSELKAHTSSNPSKGAEVILYLFHDLPLLLEHKNSQAGMGHALRRSILHGKIVRRGGGQSSYYLEQIKELIDLVPEKRNTLNQSRVTDKYGIDSSYTLEYFRGMALISKGFVVTDNFELKSKKLKMFDLQDRSYAFIDLPTKDYGRTWGIKLPDIVIKKPKELKPGEMGFIGIESIGPPMIDSNLLAAQTKGKSITKQQANRLAKISQTYMDLIDAISDLKDD